MLEVGIPSDKFTDVNFLQAGSRNLRLSDLSRRTQITLQASIPHECKEICILSVTALTLFDCAGGGNRTHTSDETRF